MFSKQKKKAMEKKDASSKGCVDQRIRPLVTLLNSHPDYYTTSSCSGRIVLLRLAAENTKKDSEWLFSSHEPVKPDDIDTALKKPPEQEVWFRMEPLIIHIACSSISSASKLLEIAARKGLTHSGATCLKNRIMLELRGNQRIETLVAKNNQLLVQQSYLQALVQAANQKLKKNHEALQELTQQAAEYL